MIALIQEHLEAIYGIHCEHRVTEYLVDEPAAKALGATGRCNEELLVKEEEGELLLALYLSADLLKKSEVFNGLAAATIVDRELAAYCEIAEGVSHFLYLAHSATYHRSVSLLELEAQAEIDKFATCLFHRWEGGAADWAKELHARLFQQVSFNPLLSEQETWRYREANRISGAYCSRLIAHVDGQRMDRLLSDLRYTYRLGAEAKISHLARAA